MAALWLLPAGVLTLLSMGRWSIGLAAWSGPLFMLLFLRSVSPRIGLAAGALVYIAVYLIGWLGVLPFGGMIYALIMTAVALAHFLPFAADRLLAHRLPGFSATLLFPLALTAVGFLLTHVGYGTWTQIAYTQHGNLPLLQLVSVAGMHGITFLIGWTASVLSWAWERRQNGGDLRLGLAAVAGVLTAVHLAGAIRLAAFPPTADTFRAASITVENLDTFRLLWSPVQQGRTITPEAAEGARPHAAELHDRLLAATAREARAGARLVLWSEGNALVLREDEPALIERSQALARQEGIYLFISLATVTPGQPLVENKTIGIAPDGQVLASYLKTHPVPGEGSVPGTGALPAVETPLGKLAWAICYDYDFPELIRQAGQARADILLNPSWDSPAMAPLHTRMAVFRAVETGANMLRETNDGLSLAVDYQGSVLAAMDHHRTPGTEKVMISHLPKEGVRTLYSRIGDVFAWACIAVLLPLAAAAWRLPRQGP